MKEFVEFGLGVFNGLQRAVRTDIDVFLMACCGLALASKYRVMKGIGYGLAFYLIARRCDSLMSAYVSLKRQEIVTLMKE